MAVLVAAQGNPAPVSAKSYWPFPTPVASIITTKLRLAVLLFAIVTLSAGSVLLYLFVNKVHTLPAALLWLVPAHLMVVNVQFVGASQRISQVTWCICSMLGCVALCSAFAFL